MVWNNDCQVAFNKIKTYLLNPLVLIPSMPSRPLIMYLAIYETSMGCMLGQHDESRKKEQVIYYLSKEFVEYKSIYSSLEKTCYVLVWAAQRLQHYMLYHTTLFPDRSFEISPEKPMLLERLPPWHLLLDEFDITLLLRNS